MGGTDRQPNKEVLSLALLMTALSPGEAAALSKPSMSDLSYSDRLHQDTAYLKSSRKLTEQILDRIVLQLNRVYPQVLSNKEAEKFRSLKTPLRIRLPDLLKHLQKKGERECQEFYRALQNNADNVYSTLPSRNSLNISDPVEICPDQEKIILNDRGPIFFLACFSVAAGLAFLLYSNNSEIKSSGAAKKVFGYSALGFGRQIRNILISYLEEAAISC